MSLFIKDQDQLKLRTTGQPVRLFFVENFGFAHYPNGEMLKFLDAIANSGGNGIRVFGFFPFGRGREEEPYVRAGNKFDLDQLNLNFINYLRRWVGYAQQRGIVVLYELFDSVGLKISQIAPYHPFGEFTDGDLQAFSNLSNHHLVAYQKKYLNDIVNVLKQFPNVIFAIMNEFVGDDNWHYEMSRHVKMLAPQHLTAGSGEHSPAINDPSVDIWSSHCASYDRDACRSNLDHDLAEIRSRARNKIIGYSTDGFGLKGMKCENPDAMRSLAQDAQRNNLQIFSFLDHYAYIDFDEAGNELPVGSWYRNEKVYETSHASRANVATYQAIARVFQPSGLTEAKHHDGGQAVTKDLPNGMLHAFDATYLESSHPDVVIEKGAKAIAATTTQGYLCRTKQISGLPLKTLQAYVSVFIDNNTGDDELVLILDVYDSVKKQVLAIQPLTRKKFFKAQEFYLVPLVFSPSSTSSAIELRVYYFGHAYVAVNKLAIVDPQKLRLQTPDDIPESNSDTPSPTVPETGNTGVIDIFDVTDLSSNHPEAFPDRGGRAIRATTRAGFLAYGPYAEGYPAKSLTVYFSALIDNNTADNSRILSLDVYDSFQKKLLGNTSITRKEFSHANDWSLFKLTFTPVEKSILEFRIYYHGGAYVAADKIAVVDPTKVQIKNHAELMALTVGGGSGYPDTGGGGTHVPDTGGSGGGVIEVLDALNLPTNHPDAFPDRGGRAVRATTRAGFLTYGPYAKGYPTQLLAVYFSAFIDNNTADNLRILSIDVHDAFQKKVLAQAAITRKQFSRANDWSIFKLTFTPVEKSSLEFRVYYHGYSYIAVDKIAVVDPEKVQISTHAELLTLTGGGHIPDTPADNGGPTIPAGNAIISESLKNGITTAETAHVSFVSGGLQLHSGEGYLRYTVSSLPRGFVEFSGRGFVEDELHGGSEYKGVLLTMWDTNVGYSYESASFIFELRKYGYIEGRPDASNTLWFKIKSNGEWTENHRTILPWDPSRTYRFRLEWGGGTTRILRDGQETATGVYRAEFTPVRHAIQIGANPLRGRKCPHDIVISDVVIGRL